MAYDERDEQNRKEELYRKYYEASRCGDEWAGIDKAEIAKKIKDIEEAESWNSGGN